MKENISFIIYRNEESVRSTTDKAFRGMDYAILTNHDTGEQVYIYGAQTVVSHSEFPVSNTVRAFSGDIEFQYLGNNTGKGSLYGGFESSYQGPIFNVTNTITEGLAPVNGRGEIEGSADTSPLRVHSDTKLSGVVVPLASGGCFMWKLKELMKCASVLDRWEVKPGDIIKGYVNQSFPQ